MVHTIPFGVMNPVLLEDAAGLRVIDAKQAAEFNRSRLVNLIGEKFCKMTDGVRIMHLRVELFKMRSTAEAPAFMGGESARMTPSRPTRGSIWGGTYARRLNGLVNRHTESTEMFEAWRPKMKLIPTASNAGVIKERAIFFFPTAGLSAKERREIYGVHSR